MGEDVDDFNDIRLALGTLVTGQHALIDYVERIGERLDDVTALAARTAAFSELLDDLETIVSTLPAGIRKLAQDPMIGTMVGPQVEEIAQGIDDALAFRRTRRAAAPGIEKV